MLSGSITNRYTLGLYQVAVAQNQVSALNEGLQMMASFIRETEGLKAFLESPVVSDEKKYELIRKAFGDSIPSVLHTFFRVLLLRGRIPYFEAIAERFRGLVEQAENQVTVQIESAQPLKDEAISEIANKLSSVLNKRTVTRTAIKPELLAGMRVRIGHRVVDATVKGQLDRFRHDVLSNVAH